ncbi:MAG: glycosyltransferase family 9 protein [Chthoniobacteraceae bacterium]
MSAPSANPDSFLTRLRKGIVWRRLRFKHWLTGRARRLPPEWVFRLRWPVRRPWQRASLRLLSFGGGIGDELMCLPVFREIKRRNPRCRLTFVTRHPDLFEKLDCLDEIVPFSTMEESSRGAVVLAYGPPVPPPRALITHIAECVGLEMESSPPTLPRVEPSAALRAQVDALPRPRVIVQPRASRWTPVKQWPIANWETLIERLSADYTVIEVGAEPLAAARDFGPRFHSFAGKTSMEDFLWLVGQGDVFVGPSSGGMHVAAGHGLPSVITFGGYEHPDGYRYPKTTGFYRAVECAPCWRTDECPYGLKCMWQITPDEVFAAVRSALAG